MSCRDVETSKRGEVVGGEESYRGERGRRGGGSELEGSDSDRVTPTDEDFINRTEKSLGGDSALWNSSGLTAGERLLTKVCALPTAR